MNTIRNKWLYGLIVGVAITALSGALQARDRGVNQRGAVGGTAGAGAPGVGVVDPGLNQPGARGNAGAVGTPGVGVGAPGAGAAPRVGVGAPGAGAVDRGVNQPGAVGNTAPARRGVRP